MRVRLALKGCGLLAPILLAGCSLFPSTRKLPVPKAPAVMQTATPEELVAMLNKNWDALNNLTVKVTITATMSKPSEGTSTTEPTFPAHIILGKPGMLRILAQVPVLRTEMFDMGSDGKNFTLYVPSKKEAVKGPNALTKKSANDFENMRPAFFFDAMVVRGLEQDDDFFVTLDSPTIEDPQKKYLLSKPEYILSIMRPRADSRELTPVRVVTFDRSNLEPYKQDVYDAAGNLETQVVYGNYQDFNGVSYPSSISIKRPLESYQIVLTVLTVTENQQLDPDEFVVDVPPGTQIKNLE
jgi:outer membrane lipoprotein-sorting protein